MRGLKGKTAIVTGGAAGIGAAIVQRFRAEGSRVVVDLEGDPPVDITDYAALMGPLHVLHCVLPGLVERGRGKLNLRRTSPAPC